MSAPQRLSTFKTLNRFTPLDGTNPTPPKERVYKPTPDPKDFASSKAKQHLEVLRKQRRDKNTGKAKAPTTTPDQDTNMDQDHDATPTRGRGTSHDFSRERSVSRTRNDPMHGSDSDSDLQPLARTTEARAHRSRSSSAPPRTRTLDYDLEDTIATPNSDSSFEPHDELNSSHEVVYPPSPPFSAISEDSAGHSSTGEFPDPDPIAPSRLLPTPTPDPTNSTDDNATQSDDYPPPLATNTNTSPLRPTTTPAPPATTNTPTRPSDTPPTPKPLSYADVIRDANSDASSDHNQIPAHLRSRFLRPPAAVLPRLLAMAASVNAAPPHAKMIVMESLHQAIVQARPYVERAEVTWVYFPRPDKVVHKGKTRNVLGLSEKFHYKFTLGEQDPIFSAWKDHLGRFEYAKLHEKPIVRVHLSSYEARDALLGKPMDLGYFGIVTLQGAPIDPWDAIQYIDIPNLPRSEWQNVANGFATLGAMPSFFGCRQGQTETSYCDIVPRFYFDKTFPTCLTIGGKLPRQISHGGRLYMVFVKNYSPPRMDNPRRACAELLTLNPPTRHAPDSEHHAVAPEAKRARTTPTPLEAANRKAASRKNALASIQNNDDPNDSSDAEAFEIALINYAATLKDGADMIDDSPPPCLTRWTPFPDMEYADEHAPHAQTPARLFAPGTATYKSKSFPYRRLDAQFVTLTKGKYWPQDLSPAIRHIQQQNGRLALSKTALTMLSLDKWIDEQEKSIPTLPAIMENIENTIEPDLAPVHANIREYVNSNQPHAVVKLLQSKYVAGQCSLATFARLDVSKGSPHANWLAQQHFFQRVLSATTPLHCRSFPSNFTNLYQAKPNLANTSEAMANFWDSPTLKTKWEGRPQGPTALTIGQHEMALAWFELHLMAQAPTFYPNHAAHALMAGGLAVNRLPAWNSEFLPSWLLQRIVQSSLGQTIIKFMNEVEPNHKLNKFLLAESMATQWRYPTLEYITIVHETDNFVTKWTPQVEYPTQAYATSLQLAAADTTST